MEENKEITFGRILKVAFSNWKLFTPVALVVALGVALGIHFGYNTLKGNYTSTFSYSSADLANDKYADGSDFFYKNIVSYTNLNAVKASDEKYANIDVDKIVDKNAISITASEEGEKTYTLKLSYRYIKDEKLAKSFIKDLAESALKKDAKIVNEGSYDASLRLFDTAESFEDKVMYLNAQAQYLTNQYKSLSAINDNTDQTKKQANLPTSVVEQISANNQKLELLIPKTFVTSMNTRIASEGYNLAYDDAAIAKLNKKYAELELEEAKNTSDIDALKVAISNLGQAAAVSDISKYLELVLRNEDIALEKTAIDNKKGHAGQDPAVVNASFVAELAGYRSDLNTAIDEYKGVLRAAYIDNASVEYEDSSIIKLNGTIGLLINALISVAVGVVVGAAVNLIVDRKKLYE